MNVRPLDSKTLPEYIRLCSYAFGMPDEHTKRYTRWVGQHLACSRGAFDGKTMLAGMWYYPFEMRVGEAFIPMGGVAAVATRPEARNHGCVREMMHSSHRQMKNEGRPLAVLMPFKSEFYGRMGYADVFFCHRHEFSPNDLFPIPKPRAAVREIDGTRHWRTLESLQRWYATRYLGAVKRDAVYWKEKWLQPYVGLRKVYLVERESEAVGFIITTLSKTAEDSKQLLTVNQTVWTDADAQRAILAFLRAHRDQVKTILWILPPDVDLFPFVESTRFKATHQGKMMLKLVDVEAAIESRQYPDDLDASLILSIKSDPTSEWNEGRWLVAWKDGHARATRIRQPLRGRPLLECDPQSLARIYSGYKTVNAHNQIGLLKASNRATEILDRAFPAGTAFMQEWF